MLNTIECADSFEPIQKKQDFLEQLISKKTRKERELADINAAIDAINAYPEVVRVMQLIANAR